MTKKEFLKDMKVFLIPECHLCEEAFDGINTSMFRDKKEIKVIFSPDINCSGFVTGIHIGIDKE